MDTEAQRLLKAADEVLLKQTNEVTKVLCGSARPSSTQCPTSGAPSALALSLGPPAAFEGYIEAHPEELSRIQEEMRGLSLLQGPHRGQMLQEVQQVRKAQEVDQMWKEAQEIKGRLKVLWGLKVAYEASAA